MLEFKKHEQLEMELLDILSKAGFLKKLIFGGGTALRLCFGLNRYSVDLDFWTKKGFKKAEFRRMRKVLEQHYELTDFHEKHFSYLFEIRSPEKQKRLKIEIRKDAKTRFETEINIAFSPMSQLQVQVTTFTLEQMWKNKIEALVERKAIRDAYDLEFLYKKGVGDIKKIKPADRVQLINILKNWKTRDLKVTLGSVLEANERKYYVQNGFKILINALTIL